MNKKYYIPIIAFFIAVFIWQFPYSGQTPEKTSTKDSTLSEVVELKKAELDYSNMPSYAQPKAYKIGKRTQGDFIIIWPSGSTYNDIYPTIEEAQIAINEIAAQSKRNWEESGGLAW